MSQFVEHIRDTVRGSDDDGEALLDIVVATHEHKDHLSGFNQARDIFSNDIEFGSVWLGWTENLTKSEVKKIKQARKKAAATLQAAIDSPLAGMATDQFDGIRSLLGFSSDEDSTGAGRISEALEYLKLRGEDANDLRYLEPGTGPFELDGLDGVRVYVLGPPLDPILLKGSEVTEQMKKDGIIYHLGGMGDVGFASLAAALSQPVVDGGSDAERHQPFSAEHRIFREVSDPSRPDIRKPNVYFEGIRDFIQDTYDDPKQEWRRIDGDWLNAFGQLALDLDNDTNNTSLVLAFEFVKSGEVLLFVGDAQVGNWQSWANIEFTVPGRSKPMPALDLLSRTVFYKVGHHCSHNATLKKGGLELMTRDDLVAFIPLDIETAGKQGKTGWDMPATPLHNALKERTGNRVVISDVSEKVSSEAKVAGVIATEAYVDYYLV